MKMKLHVARARLCTQVPARYTQRLTLCVKHTLHLQVRAATVLCALPLVRILYLGIGRETLVRSSLPSKTLTAERGSRTGGHPELHLLKLSIENDAVVYVFLFNRLHARS